MRLLIKRIFAAGIILSIFNLALADSGFVVKRIHIQGLQNLKSSTVRNYLPIHAGQRFSYSKSKQVLQALYKTGFFYTASLDRRGSTLVVKVKERPMISMVNITGNKEISSSKIQPVLKKLDVATGNTYDPMKLQLFDSSLEQQYSMLGYAATNVTSQTKPLSHNRVALTIKVDEGQIVKVNSIKFVGNHAFSESKLRHQFKMTTPGILTWFTHTDRYSEYKLNQDITSLSNFYLNHGYIRFRVDDKKIDYVQGHKRVNITIYVSEGPIYHISNYRISGQTHGYDARLTKLVTFKKGDVFSRQEVINSETAINNFLADRAYAFNKVNVVPNIDDLRHTVTIDYNIATGNKVYVNRINFSGNTTTNQDVLRREMRQLEAAPYSLTNVNESKRRLMLTSYFSDVNVTTTPVLGTNNQVDLDYTVKETPSGKASIQGGYSSAYGFLYGASISQPNFLGSGDYVSIGFTNSQVTQNYSFSFVDPYYTWYHVSRGFSLFYNRNKYDKSFGYTPYVMNSLGADVNFGAPLSENNGVTLDLGYQRVDLSHLSYSSLAPSVQQFLRQTGPICQSFTSSGQCNLISNLKRDFNVTKAVATWTYNGQDRYLMPTSGLKNQFSVTVGVPIFSQNLPFYTVTDNASAYIPLFHGFILNILGDVGYGNGFGKKGGLANGLPFIYNFYAGGIGTVPGYAQNTLGPKYGPGTANSGSALGGNLLTTAGVHLVLPNFFSKSVRIAATFDVGNVFQLPVNKADKNTTFPDSNGKPHPIVVTDDSFALKNMRMSAGVLVTWYTPFFGPIDLSLAFPLNSKKYDQEEKFQFAMGLSF